MKITLFYKNVTVLDYAFLNDDLGVVGDSLHVDVEFIGTTDEEGILFDFSHAKKKVKEIIDRDCDHRLVIPSNLATYNSSRASFEYSYGLNDKKLSYDTPREGICELPFSVVNLANLRAYLEQIVQREMPENVTGVNLELRSESFSKDDSVFQYTHGLKDHYGNCQRLFHGHKNTVHIDVNGERRTDLEHFLAKDLFKSHIHFCFWENVQNKEAIEKITGSKPVGIFKDCPAVEISYEANQGHFFGTVAGDEVYFLQEESTVENLSIHFARLIKSKLSEGDNVTVRAYEGIAKGAKTSV
jgi:6-pyruvoyl-tetrahydropterin synthase